MFSVARLFPVAASFMVAPLTFVWGAGTTAQPAMAEVQAPRAAEQGVEVKRAKDGLFYVDVAVNGRPVHFLVDTGANVMMLTGEDARRVGIGRADERYGARVATAGGNAPMAWARVEKVALAGRELSDVRAGVVHRGLQVSLLGQNMLSHLASVRIEGDSMRME